MPSNVIMVTFINLSLSINLKPYAGGLALRVNTSTIPLSVGLGFDAALLVVALSLGLVDRYNYSAIMIAITLLTLVVPLLFNIKAPINPAFDRNGLRFCK